MSDSATPWTVACQASLSIQFSRQEHWSGLPFPFPEDLPDPGIEPASLALLPDSLTSESFGFKMFLNLEFHCFAIYSVTKNITELFVRFMSGER